MKTKTTTDQQTRSLEQLLKDVDDGKIVLPEFQRDFIWPEAKSLTLFEKLIYWISYRIKTNIQSSM